MGRSLIGDALCLLGYLALLITLALLLFLFLWWIFAFIRVDSAWVWFVGLPLVSWASYRLMATAETRINQRGGQGFTRLGELGCRLMVILAVVLALAFGYMRLSSRSDIPARSAP